MGVSQQISALLCGVEFFIEWFKNRTSPDIRSLVRSSDRIAYISSYQRQSSWCSCNQALTEKTRIAAHSLTTDMAMMESKNTSSSFSRDISRLQIAITSSTTNILTIATEIRDLILDEVFLNARVTISSFPCGRGKRYLFRPISDDDFRRRFCPHPLLYVCKQLKQEIEQRDRLWTLSMFQLDPSLYWRVGLTQDFVPKSLAQHITRIQLQDHELEFFTIRTPKFNAAQSVSQEARLLKFPRLELLTIVFPQYLDTDFNGRSSETIGKLLQLIYLKKSFSFELFMPGFHHETKTHLFNARIVGNTIHYDYFPGVARNQVWEAYVKEPFYLESQDDREMMALWSLNRFASPIWEAAGLQRNVLSQLVDNDGTHVDHTQSYSRQLQALRRNDIDTIRARGLVDPEWWEMFEEAWKKWFGY